MAIKINNQDLQARYINGNSIGKVMLNGWQIRPETIPPVFDDYLWISKVSQWWSGSTFKIGGWSWSGWWYAVSLEISNDKEHWTDYTLGTYWGIPWTWKTYIRNKSETPTRFSTWRWDFWTFYLWSATYYMWWDISTLLCKYGTTTISNYCFYRFFDGQGLKSIPHFPATELSSYCYSMAFRNSWVDISDTQTWEFQYEFRLPNVWTWTDNTWWTATGYMFYSSWSVVNTPSVNTTYYCNVPVY